MVDDPAIQIPLSQECVEAVCWWLQEERLGFGVPLQVPPPSMLLHTDMCLSVQGAHLVDGVCGPWNRAQCTSLCRQ